MTASLRAGAAALVAVLTLAACSAPTGGTQNPTVTGTPAPAATSGVAPTTGAAAGEPCSFLTAEQVGAIMGSTPVEVAERVGRGDCDYLLDAAGDAKVNIGVFTGAEAGTSFDGIRALGTPEAVTLGDEAFSIYNESFGTVVAVRQGDSTAVAQVFAGVDPAEQLRQATALAKAIIAGL